MSISSHLHRPPYSYWEVLRALLLGCVILLSSCAPPESPSTSPAAPTGASIAGTVREAGTGRPVSGANVFVVRTSNQSEISSITDGDGRFTLSGLKPGRHAVALFREGYVLPSSLEGAGFAYRLGENQHINEVEFQLIPAGNITGRVLNMDGQPVRRVEVQLLQERYFVGRRQWTHVAPSGAPRTRVETDDRGNFRVVGVDPGSYRVRLNPREFTAESVIPGGKPLHPFLYPQAVNVDPGKEVRLDDVKLQGAKRGWIKIAILDESGEDLEGLGAWQIEPPGWVGSDYPFFEQRVIGNYHEFQPDETGTYDVRAMWTSPKGTVAGKMTVSYQGADIERKLTLFKPKGRITGDILLDDKPAPGVEIAIGPEIPYFSRSKDDGKFEFPGVYAGLYKFGFIRGVPQDAYVVSMRQGTRDVLLEDLLVPNGETTVSVVVSSKGGITEGKIVDAAGKPAHNALIALVPEGVLRDRSDYYGVYQNTRSDQNGEFELHGTTPGLYQAYAWAGIPPGAFRNAEFMKQFVGMGIPVKVEAGQRVAVSLKLLPDFVNGLR
jgi:protocatechuate 3,4-dioxygenase beta subunit